MSDDLILLPGSPDAPRIGSAPPHLRPDRKPVKHLLIGEPEVVRLCMHTMHVKGYAEAVAWSTLLAVPEHHLCLTPAPSDVVSILVKYMPYD